MLLSAGCTSYSVIAQHFNTDQYAYDEIQTLCFECFTCYSMLKSVFEAKMVVLVIQQYNPGYRAWDDLLYLNPPTSSHAVNEN